MVMTSYAPPPPLPPSLDGVLTRTIRQELRKVKFPTIQELVKKIPPPGSTPIGSATDVRSETTTATPRAGVVRTSSSEVTGTPSSRSRPRFQRQGKKGLAIGSEASRSISLRDGSSIGTAGGGSRGRMRANYILDENANPTIASSSSTLDVESNTESVGLRPSLWERMGRSIPPVTIPSPRKSRTASTSKSATPKLHQAAESDEHTSNTYLTTYTSSANNALLPGDETSSNSQVTHPPFTTSATKKLHDYPRLTSVISDLREREVVFDRTTVVEALKSRILRGERVTHDEIKAVRHLTLPPHHRHLGMRLPWSKDLYCIKGLVHIPTPNKPAPPFNTFGSADDLRIPTTTDAATGGVTEEHWGRRHYVVNLVGFEDDEIALYLEGKNRLVIRVVRPDRQDGTPPMSVTETVLLPPDLPADNLRIVRKPCGTTIIEESWRF